MNRVLHECQDVDSPRLFKDILPYSELPLASFGDGFDVPGDIWVSDTTLRDGQQSMRAFTTAQSVRIYRFLHEIDNGTGAVRQCEFFVYSQSDRSALLECLELGYAFPEVTAWIRASAKDFEIVKSLGVPETGMLMSCSDYHIFKKFNSTRSETMRSFLDVTEMCLKAGIRPRCHLEDLTRADMAGFVVPLVKNLKDMCEGYGMPLKIRACDTLGIGLPFKGSNAPRGVADIITTLREECGLESGALEWHGHNDFHLAVANSLAAWAYGASSVSSTLLGIGERCGNTSLEGMLLLLCQIKKDLKLKLEVLNDVVDFFQKELDFLVPEKYPLVGSDFNTTKAGIHADGLLKDPEIYNAFDTKSILDRPIVIAINQASGTSGIAGWLNNYYKLKDSSAISKRDPGVARMREIIDAQYEEGRTENITNEELRELTARFFPELAAKLPSKPIAKTEL